MKNFSLLIAGLATMTLVFIIVGVNMNKQATHGSNPHRVEALEVRIAPVSQSYLGAEGEAAVAAVSAEIDSSNAMASAGEPLAAAGEPDETQTEEATEAIDGGEIFNSTCFACHTAGVAGAPKLEAAAWEDRIAMGFDHLVENAINGFQGDSGMMPAKGGRMDLSDAQVKATVQWMLDHLE